MGRGKGKDHRHLVEVTVGAVGVVEAWVSVVIRLGIRRECTTPVFAVIPYREWAYSFGCQDVWGDTFYSCSKTASSSAKSCSALASYLSPSSRSPPELTGTEMRGVPQEHRDLTEKR